MAEAASDIQIHLVDEVTPGLERVQAMLARLGFPAQLETDPLTIAVECAVYAVMTGGTDPHDIAMKAVRAQPPNATDFERGLTMGIASCLATEQQAT